MLCDIERHYKYKIVSFVRDNNDITFSRDSHNFMSAADLDGFKFYKFSDNVKANQGKRIFPRKRNTKPGRYICKVLMEEPKYSIVDTIEVTPLKICDVPMSVLSDIWSRLLEIIYITEYENYSCISTYKNNLSRHIICKYEDDYLLISPEYLTEKSGEEIRRYEFFENQVTMLGLNEEQSKSYLAFLKRVSIPGTYKFFEVKPEYFPCLSEIQVQFLNSLLDQRIIKLNKLENDSFCIMPETTFSFAFGMSENELKELIDILVSIDRNPYPTTSEDSIGSQSSFKKMSF